MKIDPTVLLGIILPLLIATATLLVCFVTTRKHQTHIDSVILYLVFFLNLYGGYVLVGILQGGWPTYSPHIAIAISTILVIAQRIYHKTKKT